MDTTEQLDSRPLAVNLALIVFLANCATSMIPPVLYGHWNSPLVYVKFGPEFIMMLFPLWFIFRGRNWARWLLVAIAVGGFCVSLPQLIGHFETHSISWITKYTWRNLITVGALIALFLPVSSRWFSGLKHRRSLTNL
jgi:hypothetical protein